MQHQEYREGAMTRTGATRAELVRLASKWADRAEQAHREGDAYRERVYQATAAYLLDEYERDLECPHELRPSLRDVLAGIVCLFAAALIVAFLVVVWS